MKTRAKEPGEATARCRKCGWKGPGCPDCGSAIHPGSLELVVAVEGGLVQDISRWNGRKLVALPKALRVHVLDFDKEMLPEDRCTDCPVHSSDIHAHREF